MHVTNKKLTYSEFNERMPIQVNITERDYHIHSSFGTYDLHKK